MKSFKNIALGAFLTVSAFGAVLYTSCTKDECKDVVCQNGGTCSSGTCTCATGYTGTKCETTYRAGFANTYKGNGADNAGGTYSNFRLVFAATGTDVNKMTVTVQDAAGGSADIPVLTVNMSNYTSTGATFTAESVTSAGFTYTASGSISGTTATMTVSETGNPNTIYSYTNFVKQ